MVCRVLGRQVEGCACLDLAPVVVCDTDWYGQPCVVCTCLSVGGGGGGGGKVIVDAVRRGALLVGRPSKENWSEASASTSLCR